MYLWSNKEFLERILLIFDWLDFLGVYPLSTSYGHVMYLAEYLGSALRCKVSIQELVVPLDPDDSGIGPVTESSCEVIES